MPRTLEECDEAITAILAEIAEIKELLDAHERTIWPKNRMIRHVGATDPEFEPEE